MKISLNWIKQFTDVEISVDELVAKIGSQLGEVEEVIHIGEQYKDVVIAKVVQCDKHPNADKLSLCLLDDGGITPDVNRDENGLVQVVCGAPNIKAEMLVAWLPPGSIVPETYLSNDQFKLEARELRGVISNGMVASARELGVGDEHDGILEIDLDAQPGDSFAEKYEFIGDVVIDIENKMFTHRPDCFGILGIAREIAGIQHIQFKSPEWYQEQVNAEWLEVKDKKLTLTVDNQLPELVPRFMAVAMAGVEVKQSSVMMRSYLSRVGLKPINSIVDITNFMMQLTGQPLHAFDYDKVAAMNDGQAVIEVRHSKEGESLKLLNGKTIEPREEAIMIATPKALIGVGGVMGGSDTEVDFKTKNIILECATFDMYSIRRTSMAHGLFTDAVTRYSKGQSPRQNKAVAVESLRLILDAAGGSVASDLVDDYEETANRKQETVRISAEFINERLGTELPAEQSKELLTNVEFSVEQKDGHLEGVSPFWRTDIEIPEDIVEEVGRLYGYDNIDKKLPTRSIKPTRRSDLLQFKQRLREALAQAGTNEALTYSFVNKDLLETVGQKVDDAYTLSNALSPDLQKYRLSLTPSLLSHVHANIKAGYKEFALFEVGKTHNRQHLNEEQVPTEIESVALVYARDFKGESGAALYAARRILDHLAASLHVEFLYDPFAHDPGFSMTAPFDIERSAAVTIAGYDGVIGVIGEYKTTVSRKLKLPAYSSGFELSTEDLCAAADALPQYRPLSVFPSKSLDVTLQVKASTTFAELYQQLQTAADQTQEEARLTIIPVQNYQAEDGDEKNVTFRLTLYPHSQTLTAEEANRIKDSLLEAVNVEFSIV